MKKNMKLLLVFMGILILSIFNGCGKYSKSKPGVDLRYEQLSENFTKEEIREILKDEKMKSAEKRRWKDKNLKDMIPWSDPITYSEDWDWISRRSKVKKSIQAHNINGVYPRVDKKYLIKKPSNIETEIWVIEKYKVNGRKYNLNETLSLTTTIDRKIIALPLKHTSVNAAITGFIASVSVEQRFYNPYDTKIEAVYTFPLPQNAAVTDFVMKIGGRYIRGMIREKEEAKRIYNRAKSQGHTASLLTQQRPNVFTQKVANIEPLKMIDIEISYFNTLPLRDGEYEFVFPTVVGPRFNPSGTKDPIVGSNAANIKISKRGTGINYTKRVNNFISMNITLNAGVSINKVFSSSHKIKVKKSDESNAVITLSKGVAYPDKDFILRFSTFKKSTHPYFINETTNKGKFFSLVVQPPANLSDIKKSPQELIFVLDCSGSMNGWPVYQAKKAIKRCLKKLDSKDTFQIIQFSNNASQLGPHPVQATRENIRKGLAYLESLRGHGGTQMIQGIRAALNYKRSEHRERIISFMTDGFIGNETEILLEIKKHLNGARIFSFGVGSSVNRYLLEEMAKLGNGGVAFISENSKWEKKVDAFYDRISHPAIKNIKIDWNGLNVKDVYPKNIPDLFIGRPIVIVGKYTGELPAGIVLNGWLENKPKQHVVKINSLLKSQGKGVSKVWAREKLRVLSIDRMDKDSRKKKKEMIKFSKDFRVMCGLTSFIAVDSLKKTKGRTGVTVKVPVPVPAGVKYETTVENE